MGPERAQRAGADAIEITTYSPMWPAVFEIERDRLAAIFGPDGAVIEHIGSTAVPGLSAKPVIDVMLGVPVLAIVERVMPALAEDGYRYVPEFEKSVPDRRYFVKPDGQPGHFHLHAVVMGSPFWRDRLAFRDALRGDAALAEEYLRLKKRLAARSVSDRTAQADAKTNFIRSVVERTR
jgi:GrpB-like predicted nucleotidyltransferase (UPF0157 family)